MLRSIQVLQVPNVLTMPFLTKTRLSQAKLALVKTLKTSTAAISINYWGGNALTDVLVKIGREVAAPIMKAMAKQ